MQCDRRDGVSQGGQGHGVGQAEAAATGGMGSHLRSAAVSRASVLREAESAAGGGKVRRLCRRVMPAVLRRRCGSPRDTSGGVLPDAAGGVL